MSQAVQRARDAKASMYRSLIVDAAEKLFAERGYENTKIQDIAVDSGISLGTLYSVFGGKAAVYDAVQSDRLSEVFMLAADSMDSEESAADRLLHGNRQFIRWLTEHPAFLRIHLGASSAWSTHPGDVADEQVEAWRRGINLIAGVFSQAIAEGDAFEGDPVVAARLMVATQQVFMSAWVDSGMKEDADSLADRIEQHIERALLRRER